MADEPHLLKGIPDAHAIRVAGQQETLQQKQEQQMPRDKREQPANEEEEQPESTGELLPQWWHYRIELGRLLLEQKNLELSLFTSLSEDALAEERKDRRKRERDLQRIKARIAELEQRIASLEWEETHRSQEPQHIEIDRQIQGLVELLGIYTNYYQHTIAETDAIMHGDLTTLTQLMSTKKSLLQRVGILQQMLNLSLFRELGEDDAKRIKASGILSDIHSETTRILDRENQNSVELRNQKEEVKAELGRRTTGAQAISKYATVTRSSRFIDTTK